MDYSHSFLALLIFIATDIESTCLYVSSSISLSLNKQVFIPMLNNQFLFYQFLNDIIDIVLSMNDAVS